MRLVLFVLLAVAACASPAPPAPPTPTGASLVGTEWRRIDDMNANPHGATLNFDANGASGYTGCNRWTSDVTRNGDTLRFGMIASTEMACDGVQMGTEQSFLAMLPSVRHTRRDGEELVMLDERRAEIARFRPE